MAAGSLGINVEIGAYESLVNLLQIPGNWTAAPGGATTSISLNSSGDPSSDASLTFDYRVNQPWNGPDPVAVGPNLSGTYHLSFNGQASIGEEYSGFSTSFTVANQVYNASTNTTTADLIVPSNNTSEFFGITLWNTQATPTSGTNTGFSNARLIRPGYAANSTQLYTNEFLAALKPYGTLRYLDPENTNGQPFFSGNTLVTVNASEVDQTGLPWEYLVTLANQTNTDMWINIPEGATDDYISALAGIIKNGGTVNGVTYAGLNPNLKVYVEYSNEVWGGIPFNEYYQEAAVQNSATNQPLSTFAGNQYVYTNPDGTTSTDVNQAVGRRYLERTAEIGQIFQNVIGSDPTHQRIRPVLGWQENDPGFYESAIPWFETFFGSASAAFYGLGNADYWSPTDYSSVDAAIRSLQAQETSSAIPNTIDYTTLATYYGLKNVSYEGGPAISGNPSDSTGQVALATSRDPRIEQLVAQHYLNYFADGGALANYYSGPYGILSPGNQWPIVEDGQYGNPSSSPRYEGTVDVSNASPVAVTAGVPVSATSPTNFSASTDTIGSSFGNIYDQEQGFWLVNIGSAGTYDLTLSSIKGAGATPGQFKIFVNDKEVGGVFTQNQSTSIDLGKVALSSGISTISFLDVTQGSQYQPSQFTLTPTAASSFGVADPSFESVALPANSYAYNPSGSAWTFSGTTGVSANGSAFTAGNPSAPQGNQVAFLQDTGSLSESISSWAAGSYTLSFSAAQRGNYGGSEDFAVLVDGVVVGKFRPGSTSYQTYQTGAFTESSGSHTVALVGLDSLGGDNTVFLDGVSVATATTTTGPTVGDSGFESVALPANFYAYDPSGSAWTFSGTTGVSANGSAFTAGNPSAPQGNQVAFLQDTGSLSESISSWAAGSYTLSFSAAQRGNYGGSEDFAVLVDGVVVGKFRPGSTSYQTYQTGAFTESSGSHTVALVGLDSLGGDNTVFLDGVSVATATTTTGPTVGDSGFESVALPANFYAYDPSGSAWTFSGTTGVSANGSAFTAGNPSAPQGNQVAFLQDTGSLSESISSWAAGSYTLSFSAAQRGNYGGSEDFAVLVDGVVVGKFRPGSTSYQTYQTGAFTESSGSHTVALVGLDTSGGDNTVFLDGVSVATATTTTGPTVGDPSFESVALPANFYVYDPSGSAWTFSGTTGVSANGSAFTAGNPSAPQGNQVAFLQDTGSLSESISSWAAGSYTLSFSAAQRGNYGGSEDFAVLVDGVVVGKFRPGSTSYQTYQTGAFTVSSGSHTVALVGLDSSGGDNTVFLDNIAVH